MHPITNIVIVILTSGAVSAILSFYLRWKYEKREIKRDVLRRFVANRYRLTGAYISDGEPFIALNEVFLVFSEHPQVISDLRIMHQELGIEERLIDNIVTLTKAMAKAAKVPIRDLNDEFIMKPFTPNHKPNTGTY